MLTQKDLAAQTLNMLWSDSINGSVEATVLLGFMPAEMKEFVWEHIITARLESKACLYMYSCFRKMVQEDSADGGDRATNLLGALSPSMRKTMWKYVMSEPKLEEKACMMLFGAVKRLGRRNDQEASESISNFLYNISEEVRNAMLAHVARTYGTVHADSLLPRECHDMRDTVRAPLC